MGAANGVFPRAPFLWLLPNADIGEGMKQTENIQEPQDHDDHHDGIQDRLDRPLHRNKAIDEPEQNTHYDQNHH
jgi:hypothetical protein